MISQKNKKSVSVKRATKNVPEKKPVVVKRAVNNTTIDKNIPEEKSSNNTTIDKNIPEEKSSNNTTIDKNIPEEKSSNTTTIDKNIPEEKTNNSIIKNEPRKIVIVKNTFNYSKILEQNKGVKIEEKDYTEDNKKYIETLYTIIDILDNEFNIINNNIKLTYENKKVNEIVNAFDRKQAIRLLWCAIQLIHVFIGQIQNLGKKSGYNVMQKVIEIEKSAIIYHKKCNIYYIISSSINILNEVAIEFEKYYNSVVSVYIKKHRAPLHTLNRTPSVSTRFIKMGRSQCIIDALQCNDGFYYFGLELDSTVNCLKRSYIPRCDTVFSIALQGDAPTRWNCDPKKDILHTNKIEEVIELCEKSTSFMFSNNTIGVSPDGNCMICLRFYFTTRDLKLLRKNVVEKLVTERILEVLGVYAFKFNVTYVPTNTFYGDYQGNINMFVSNAFYILKGYKESLASLLNLVFKGITNIIYNYSIHEEILNQNTQLGKYSDNYKRCTNKAGQIKFCRYALDLLFGISDIEENATYFAGMNDLECRLISEINAVMIRNTKTEVLELLELKQKQAVNSEKKLLKEQEKMAELEIVKKQNILENNARKQLFAKCKEVKNVFINLLHKTDNPDYAELFYQCTGYKSYIDWSVDEDDAEEIFTSLVNNAKY